MKLYLENISLKYGNQAFHYNLHVSQNIVAVFGPSGSGKTTLMNLIAGLEHPEKGKLVFNGTLFFDDKSKICVPAHKRKVGVVFQDHNLFPHLNVMKNLSYGLPYNPQKHPFITFDRIVELLDLGSLLKKKPYQLSGGERQRVAIGRTLLSQPQLLLLDEPFSNLDRNRRKQIISYLLRINNLLGIPMLVISHDMEDILKLTNQFVIIEQGKIAEQGHYLEIMERGKVQALFEHKRMLNIFDLYQKSYDSNDGLHTFSKEKNEGPEILRTWHPYFKNTELDYQRVRFCIFPEDIAISNSRIENISIQNQLLGTVSKISRINGSAFVTVNCGIPLTAEITPHALAQMQLAPGKKVFCLIKSKAIEVVHMYLDQYYQSTFV